MTKQELVCGGNCQAVVVLQICFGNTGSITTMLGAHYGETS